MRGIYAQGLLEGLFKLCQTMVCPVHVSLCLQVNCNDLQYVQVINTYCHHRSPIYINVEDAVLYTGKPLQSVNRLKISCLFQENSREAVMLHIILLTDPF